MNKKIRTALVIIFNTIILLIFVDQIIFYSYFKVLNKFNYDKFHNRAYKFNFNNAERLEYRDDDSELIIQTSIGSKSLFKKELNNSIANNRNIYDEIDYSQKISNDFWIPGKAFQMRPNNITRSIVKSKTGKLIYDVEYKINKSGIRETTMTNIKVRNKHIHLLGCSFTFGEGLRQEDTLSSQIAKKVEKYKVFNHGAQGMGPQDILSYLENNNLHQLSSTERGLGIYLFIPDHVRRSIPSIYFLAYHGRSRYYDVSESTLEINTYQSFSDAYPAKSVIYTLLSKSGILGLFNMDIPFSYSEEDFKITARLIAEMKKQYLKQFPKDEFIVVQYPNSFFKNVMTPYLTYFGVKTLDLSGYEISNYIKKDAQLSTYDAHPSAEAIDFLSSQIVEDLKL